MIKAILIEDEVYCIETLRTLLKTTCPEVALLGEYSTAEAGMEAIEKWNPDLVFLDIEMPAMNGFQLLEQVGDLSFDVIFTTGYDQYALKAFRASALDYLLKPIVREDLEKAVQKAVKRSSPPMPQQI